MHHSIQYRSGAQYPVAPYDNETIVRAIKGIEQYGFTINIEGSIATISHNPFIDIIYFDETISSLRRSWCILTWIMSATKHDVLIRPPEEGILLICTESNPIYIMSDDIGYYRHITCANREVRVTRESIHDIGENVICFYIDCDHAEGIVQTAVSHVPRNKISSRSDPQCIYDQLYNLPGMKVTSNDDKIIFSYDNIVTVQLRADNASMEVILTAFAIVGILRRLTLCVLIKSNISPCVLIALPEDIETHDHFLTNIQPMHQFVIVENIRDELVYILSNSSDVILPMRHILTNEQSTSKWRKIISLLESDEIDTLNYTSDFHPIIGKMHICDTIWLNNPGDIGCKNCQCRDINEVRDVIGWIIVSYSGVCPQCRRYYVQWQSYSQWASL
jgi:hypothetical protein